MTCSFLAITPERDAPKETTQTGSLVAGSVELDEVTKVAKSLGDNVGARRITWIIVQNRLTNADGSGNATNILVGSTVNQTIELQPGASTMPLPIRDLADVYARSL